MDKTYDVLIMGAGMAGACLARQLRLEQPDLSIVVIDKKRQFDHWVGESTIEAFDDYARRVLKLGPYLGSRHSLKHGLRFFFDSEAKDLLIPEMSEWGRANYTPTLPAWQIDRSVFDRDMCELNRASGIDVRLGTAVKSVRDISLDGTNGHVVSTTTGDIRCRWLVDASGRNSLLGQKLGLHERSEPNQVASYWARFEGCRNIDELGDEPWGRRVEFTQRYFSTNHFMYEGYWVWVIPISDRVLSIGVTFDSSNSTQVMKNADELVSFLRQHKGLAQLLGPDPRALDFHGMKQLSRCASQHFSTDRWFLTGMSALFVDPLFSNSSLVLAFANRCIAELIRADREGTPSLFAARVKHANLLLSTSYRAYKDVMQYRRFGSFDAFAGWSFPAFNNYFNFSVAFQLQDLAPFFLIADSHEDGCDCTEATFREVFVGVQDAANRLADEYIRFLDERGAYFARNRGCFVEASPRPSLVTKALNREQDLSAYLAESLTDYEGVFRYFVRRMAELSNVPFNESVFRETFVPDRSQGQSLMQVLDAFVKAAESDSAAASPSSELGANGVKWLPKGPMTPAMLELLEVHCRFWGPDGRPF